MTVTLMFLLLLGSAVGVQYAVTLVSAVVQRAVKNKYERSDKKEHWLYYADDKYDVSIITSCSS